MDSREDPTWRESFFKANFNVDKCLSKYTLKSDLETLRTDLKNYGNELHHQMAEILKTETEGIVNLAEYLTNLSSKIDDLSPPISQLREEIKTLHDLIGSAQNSYFSALETVKMNSNKRSQLNLKLQAISSAKYIDQRLNADNSLNENLLLLDCAVTKYSFEQNYLKLSPLGTYIDDINSVGNRLTQIVNKTFLAAIESTNLPRIYDCLRMYNKLERQSEAEDIYRVHFVRPALKPLFNETYLDSHNQNLDIIYRQTLDCIESDFKFFFNVTSKRELKLYNFGLNSIWLEIDNLSREGLPHITAPGHPELFQRRFKSTWNFLQALAEMFGDSNLIESNQKFQEHIKRFNLPVYFEIRFQQIAGDFEGDAVVKPGTSCYAGANDIDCKLKLTVALWRGLRQCFDSDVFIDNLADQFLKLSMLLVARYLKWFEIALQEADSFTEGSNAWEDFIINSLNDLNLTKSLIGHQPNQADLGVYAALPIKVRPVLPKVFQLNSKTIDGVSNKIRNHLVNLQTGAALGHLQNVASIPRLYRRTNRSAPKEASNYMTEAVTLVLQFHQKFQRLLSAELQQVLEQIIIIITKKYLVLVQEVLRSVCKTEESLRRLKNRNVNSSDEASSSMGSDTISDESKIREQIKLDVCYFVDKLRPLAMAESKQAMDELRLQTN